MYEPKERPEILPSATTRQKVGCGRIYVRVSFNEDDYPMEVFAQGSKSGGCPNAQLEPFGKFASRMLRRGIDINIVLKCLKEVRCPIPYIPIAYDNTKNPLKRRAMLEKGIEKGVPIHKNGGSEGTILSCADGLYHGIKKILLTKGWEEVDGKMVKEVKEELDCKGGNKPELPA